MKIIDIPNMAVAYETKDLSKAFNCQDDLYEGMNEDGCALSFALIDKELPNITIKVHAELDDCDGRRFQRVFSVWDGDTPFVVGRMAGREGDDSYDTHILNVDSYKKFLLDIVKLYNDRFDKKLVAIDSDKEVKKYFSFYSDETLKVGKRLILSREGYYF